MSRSNDLDRFIEHIAEMLENYGEKVLEEVEGCGIMTLKEGEAHEQ